MANDDWNEGVHQSVSEKLSNTLSNQIHSRGEVEKKAAQILAADLLTGSIIIGFSSREMPSVFMLASVISMAASIYYCILVFIPKDITLGIGSDGAKSASSLEDQEYYQTLISQLGDFIDQNAEVKEDMACDLEKAIWASFTGILFFVAIVAKMLFQIVPSPIIDIVGLFVVPIITFYAKDCAESDTTNISDE